IIQLALDLHQMVENVDMSLSLGQELIVDERMAPRIEASILKGLGVILDFEFLSLLKCRQSCILIERLLVVFYGPQPCAPRAEARGRLVSQFRDLFLKSLHSVPVIFGNLVYVGLVAEHIDDLSISLDGLQFGAQETVQQLDGSIRLLLQWFEQLIPGIIR